MKVRISVDLVEYKKKPSDKDAPKICNRIGKNPVYVTIDELSKIILNGQTWVPGTFSNPTKCEANFVNQQLFALDFDGGISASDVKSRANEYDIPILLIYETFSSVNEDRFRVVFCHYSIIDDLRVAKVIQHALMELFPEADVASREVTKMYYGGKKIIYIDLQPNTFNIADLLMKMAMFLQIHRGNTHYLNYIKKLAQRTGLVLRNNYIKIEHAATVAVTSPPLENNDGNLEVLPLYILCGITSGLPNYCIIYFSNNQTQIINDRNKDIKTFEYEIINEIDGRRDELIQKFNYKKLEKCCKLFEEFYHGTGWFEHHVIYGIMTNLIQVKGGKKKFLELLYNHNNPDWNISNRWAFYADYAHRQHYKPMSCINFCPYDVTCVHNTNMIATAKPHNNTILKLNTDYEYVSLDEAVEDLEKQFNNIMNDMNKASVYLLKAQTGIGKTYTYLKYMQSTEKYCIIAVPTNGLKRQVYQSAINAGLPAMMTPSIKDYKDIDPSIVRKIQLFYDIGAGHEVQKYIRAVTKEQKNPELIKYLEDCDAISSFQGHIITTHARFVNFKEHFLKKFELIIDEDIIKTLMESGSVNADDIMRLKYKANSVPTIADKINEVESHIQKGDEYFRYFQRKPFSVKELDNAHEMAKKLRIKGKSNVLGFLKATAFYYDEKTNVIHFIVGKKLPRNLKYVILSATANEEIYKKYFGSNKIKFFECKKAKYKGNLLQYHYRTFSRDCIKTNTGIYDEVLEIIGKQNELITFKGHNPYTNDADVLHIENSEGHNKYEGKDIAVVGTPHKPEFLYKLFAFYLSINIKENLIPQEIEFNDYRFRIMTYSNPELRNIQLWTISSSLEQSIGRARLLRNDCTVYLFSNLPLDQAVIVEHDVTKFISHEKNSELKHVG